MPACYRFGCLASSSSLCLRWQDAGPKHFINPMRLGLDHRCSPHGPTPLPGAGPRQVHALVSGTRPAPRGKPGSLHLPCWSPAIAKDLGHLPPRIILHVWRLTVKPGVLITSDRLDFARTSVSVAAAWRCSACVMSLMSTTMVITYTTPYPLAPPPGRAHHDWKLSRYPHGTGP